MGEIILIMASCPGPPSSTDPPGWAVWVTLVLSIPVLSMELQQHLPNSLLQSCSQMKESFLQFVFFCQSLNPVANAADN